MQEMQEMRVRYLAQEDPLEWQATPVFLRGKFHGQSSLVGYGPRGHKVSDTTERLRTHTELIYDVMFVSVVRQVIQLF